MSSHVETASGNSRSSSAAYRPDIDGLRAIAVLSVVFSHAGLGLPGGYVGVDIFFVISGYLITNLILRDLKDGTFSFASFWERRVRRIAPALVVVTLATLALGWFLLLPQDYASLGLSVRQMAIFLSNVHFWSETGYFEGASAEKPLLHTWSLAVEEQFYLLVPVLLVLITKARRLPWMYVMLAIAAVTSFALSAYFVFRHPSATFYLLPTRAWELFCGSLIAFLPAKQRQNQTMLKESAAVAGIALILVPCFIYDHATRFPGLAALPPVAGTAMLIWSGNPNPKTSLISQILTWRPLTFIGLISYSLYLWHWPILVFARHQSLLPLDYMTLLALVAISVFIGVVSWRYIEQPFRNRKLIESRTKLFSAAFGAFLLMILGGTIVYERVGFSERLSDQCKHYASAATEVPDWFRLNRSIKDIPDNLVRLGKNHGPPRLLVWGDSHAMAILPAIDALSRETGVPCVAAVHVSTAPVIGYFARTPFGMNERAMAFSEALLQHIRLLRIRDVLLVAVWPDYCEDRSFAEAMLRTVDELHEAGVAVHVMESVYHYPFDVPKAIIKHSFLGVDVSPMRVHMNDYYAATGFPPGLRRDLLGKKVNLLDPAPYFLARVGSSTFMPYDNDGAFYADGQHLSTYGALALKPLFAPLFGPVASSAQRSPAHSLSNTASTSPRASSTR